MNQSSEVQKMAKTALQKDWYEIVSPELFGSETVAETPAEEPKSVEERTVKLGLQDLVPDTRRYYMDVYLKVTEVEGNRAKTAISGHNVSSDYVSKMVSRRSNRIDAVEDVKTSDGSRVRVKVVGATIRKTSSSQVNEVRRRMREVIREEAGKKSLDEFMESIFTGDLQKKMEAAAQKIYPLREVEVRKTEVQQ